jgi:DNA-binding NtrC family response regulator
MKQSRTALIVDDEDQLLRLLVRVLERAGYATWAAGEGAEALRVFHENASEIDLVLLDVIHPAGGGAADLLPAMLAQRPDLQVILMSGDVLPEPLALKLASIGGQFLRKPFVPRTLLRMLEPDSGSGVVTDAGTAPVGPEAI